MTPRIKQSGAYSRTDSRSGLHAYAIQSHTRLATGPHKDPPAGRP